MLLEELLTALESGLDRRPITVTQVNVGIFYTAAQLSTGHVGVAFTPRDLEDTVCCPKSAAEMPEAGKLRGQSAWDLAGQALSRYRLRRSVGVATLNALSACLMDEKEIPGGSILTDTDAMDVANIREGDSVALVGAFVPFIKKLKGGKVDLRVIDKHRDALKGEDLRFWASPDEAAGVLSAADVAIITGSAMVEGGIDDLLSYCRKAREIVLAGPTASPWPEPFFARGVTVLGGITVRDGAEFMRLIMEGGSGYFFSGPAAKIAVVRSKEYAA